LLKGEDDEDFYTINPEATTGNNSREELQDALIEIKRTIIEDQKNDKNIPFLTANYLFTNKILADAYNNNNRNGIKLLICPKTISPRGTCIGGIYAIDKDLLINPTSINPNSRTGCVTKDQHGDNNDPIECQEQQ